MAVYHGNDVHLTLNGQDVGGIFRSMDLSVSIGDENTSHGASTDWEKHSAKLAVASATATVIYDDTSADTDIAAIMDWSNDQVVTVVYGPQGNTAGDPRHEQDFLITGVQGPTTNHDKSLVVFEISMTSTGAPTANIYNGGTFS